MEQIETSQPEVDMLHREIVEELDRKIINEAKALGITFESPPTHPAALIQYSPETPTFEAKIDAQQKYRVWSGDMVCSQPFQDEQIAKDWASKLNIIGQEESEKVKREQATHRKLVDAECKFAHAREHIKRAVETRNMSARPSSLTPRFLGFHHLKNFTYEFFLFVSVNPPQS